MPSEPAAGSTETLATGAGPGPVEPSSGSSSAPDPVDWDFAERIAHRVAGRNLLADSFHRESLVDDFAEGTARAAEMVAEFTGLEPRVHAALGRVVDRQEWATLNLASFQRLLAPITERFGDRMADSPLAGFNRRVAGAEAGVLLGWFGRRVLGQYDLLDAGDLTDIAVPPQGTGSVYYVGPNVLGLEKQHGFRPRAFRLWIALHEVTHLVQFTGVPWMRDHFLALVDESLSLVDPDPKRFVEALRRVVEELRAGRNPLEAGGLMALFASDEQRALLERIQALMALLEGHGNFVMDRLGEEHVEGQAHMSQVLRQRRAGHGVGRQVQRALGLELKMRQYSVGERFFREVEEKAGSDALGVLWTEAAALPTLAELNDPDRWVARVLTAAP